MNPEVIGPFKGDYNWLSNMYIAPFEVNNILYNSVENYYQASKRDLWYSRADLEHFAILNPYESKKKGRQFTLRADWEQIKLDVMKVGIYTKFSTHKDLHALLLSTGSTPLVEINYWHDNFWGDCRCPKCSNIKGKNMLGKILMDARNYFYLNLKQ